MHKCVRDRVKYIMGYYSIEKTQCVRIMKRKRKRKEEEGSFNLVKCINDKKYYIIF